MRETFGRSGGLVDESGHADFGRCVDRDGEGHVVLRAGFGAEIEDAEVGVAGDCCYDVGVVGGELGGVDAGVDWEGYDALFSFGGPDLDGAVPAA